MLSLHTCNYTDSPFKLRRVELNGLFYRFVQYFMVSGLDVNFGLEPDEILHSLDLIPGDTSPLDRSYKPRILR